MRVLMPSRQGNKREIAHRGVARGCSHARARPLAPSCHPPRSLCPLPSWQARLTQRERATWAGAAASATSYSARKSASRCQVRLESDLCTLTYFDALIIVGPRNGLERARRPTARSRYTAHKNFSLALQCRVVLLCGALLCKLCRWGYDGFAFHCRPRTQQANAMINTAVCTPSSAWILLEFFQIITVPL